MFKKRKARKAVAAAFDALPEPAAAFADRPVIEGERSIGAWKALLGPVGAADALRDEKAREAWLTARARSSTDLDELALRKLRSGVNDHLRGTLLPILDVLEIESGAEAPLALRLDLRGLTDDKAGPEQTIEPAAGRYPRVKQTLISDSWCEGSLRLGDGASLSFRGVDRVRKREITKRNQRGTKIKTKTKHKTWAHHEVALTVAKDDYGWALTAPAARDGVRVRTRETDRKREVRLREVKTSPTRGSEPDPSWFVGMVALAYDHLMPAMPAAGVPGKEA